MIGDNIEATLLPVVQLAQYLFEIAVNTFSNRPNKVHACVTFEAWSLVVISFTELNFIAVYDESQIRTLC